MRSDERRCAHCGETGWKGWMVRCDGTDPETHCATTVWVHAWHVTDYSKSRLPSAAYAKEGS